MNQQWGPDACTTHEVGFFTANEAWEHQRLEAYRSQALGIVAALDEYEEVHPKDAPCFVDLLDAMKERVNGGAA